jgi:hypothetical protein
MAQTLKSLATKMTAATAATIATAIGDGTTAAEVTALISLMNVLAARRDLSIPPLKIVNDKNLTE